MHHISLIGNKFAQRVAMLALMLVSLAAITQSFCFAAEQTAVTDIALVADDALKGETPTENSQELIFVPIEADSIPQQLSQNELSSRANLLVLYCAVIVLSSMLGGYLPKIIHFTHTRMQILMSFVGGLMLGVALFHLLLHAVLDVPKSELSSVMTSLGLGILTMFLLLRVFHFHQHDLSDDSVASEHAHDHDHATVGIQAPMMKSRFAWMGIAFGLGLHSIMDGVALTVSCLRPAADGQEVAIWGLAAFLAIFLHKPLDAISITSVMSASGWKPSTCTAVNISFALMCPVGAMLAWWGVVGTHSHIYLVSHLLAFSAGVFFCISLSDLLPEMQFHAHNQWVLTVSLVAGLALAWGLMWLDPIHSF